MFFILKNLFLILIHQNNLKLHIKTIIKKLKIFKNIFIRQK
jgi:hypothetical protein